MTNNHYKISEIPLIPFLDAKKTFGMRNIFVKDESQNPFGTIKDRRNKLIMKKPQD